MVSIHQSQFLSWTPLYFKILSSDFFVTLDDVQFQKNGVQNRNLIKTPQGTSWITIPVKHDLNTKINQVAIDSNFNCKKLLKTIELNYKKSNFYDIVFDKINQSFEKNFKNLHDLNNDLFKKILKILRSDVDLHYSSKLNTKFKKDDLVIEIIKKIGDNDYLTGQGALNYMDLNKFKKEKIKVYTYDFNYSKYDQLWNKIGFTKDLSIIDLIFNNLDSADEYIFKCGKINRII